MLKNTKAIVQDGEMMYSNPVVTKLSQKFQDATDRKDVTIEEYNMSSMILSEIVGGFKRVRPRMDVLDKIEIDKLESSGKEGQVVVVTETARSAKLMIQKETDKTAGNIAALVQSPTRLKKP